jgi:serine/threonine-protein kinase HipA
LAGLAGIPDKAFTDITNLMLAGADKVERLTFSSFLDESTQRNYWQSYQGRLKQLLKA